MMQPTLGLDAACAVTWDAIVLGGGPAGALAARQLATGGARVLLVDKKPFPRSKVCGACLNGQALSVLRAVGLGNLVADLGGIPLDTFELRLADQSAQLSLPAGAALSRARLDAALVSAAISAGAEFLPETRASVDGVESNMRRVVLTRDGQSRMASARVVLVAAGLAHTCLARDPTFQIRTRAGSRIGAGCVLEHFPDFFRERTIFMAVGRHGYVGLVRLEDGLLNIGAALDRS
ncbi:MAG TPA: FAD-dependent monooxygenase, partial [Isosphaeraceae bacterium]|nr:FAD-dependent monooxygenase [Isosphaeraceae bacterium]